MNYDFNDKVILVTSAARGIGKEISKKFLEANATVIFTDIDDDEADNTLQELIKLGRVIYLHMDNTLEDEVKSKIKTIIQQFGKLDCAINIAPFIPPNKQLHKTESGQMKKTIDVDLMAVYYCMKYEIEVMLKAKCGNIVNISSIAGVKGIKGLAIYSAAKHGIIGLTKAAALDYGDFNIRINSVSPGMIDTETFKQLKSDRPVEYQRYIDMIPNKKPATPTEIANAVLWLASADASYANGTNLIIDNGITI